MSSSKSKKINSLDYVKSFLSQAPPFGAPKGKKLQPQQPHRKRTPKRKGSDSTSNLLSPKSTPIDKAPRSAATTISIVANSSLSLSIMPSHISQPSLTSLMDVSVLPPSPEKLLSTKSNSLFIAVPERSESARTREVPIFSYDHKEAFVLSFNDFVQYVVNYPQLMEINRPFLDNCLILVSMPSVPELLIDLGKGYAIAFYDLHRKVYQTSDKPISKTEKTSVKFYQSQIRAKINTFLVRKDRTISPKFYDAFFDILPKATLENSFSDIIECNQFAGLFQRWLDISVEHWITSAWGSQDPNSYLTAPPDLDMTTLRTYDRRFLFSLSYMLYSRVLLRCRREKLSPMLEEWSHLCFQLVYQSKTLATEDGFPFDETPSEVPIYATKHYHHFVATVNYYFLTLASFNFLLQFASKNPLLLIQDKIVRNERIQSLFFLCFILTAKHKSELQQNTLASSSAPIALLFQYLIMSLINTIKKDRIVHEVTPDVDSENASNVRSGLKQATAKRSRNKNKDRANVHSNSSERNIAHSTNSSGSNSRSSSSSSSRSSSSDSGINDSSKDHLDNISSSNTNTISTSSISNSNSISFRNVSSDEHEVSPDDVQEDTLQQEDTDGNNFEIDTMSTSDCDEFLQLQLDQIEAEYQLPLSAYELEDSDEECEDKAFESLHNFRFDS